jgi:nucleoside diphosphate kinase
MAKIDLTEEIIFALNEISNVNTVKDIKLGTNNGNQLLFFWKPELESGNITDIMETLDLGFSKFREFKVSVDGIFTTNGRALKDLDIMGRHYGKITNLSRNASNLVTASQKAEIAKLFDIRDEFAVIGGHEALAQSKFINAKVLGEWFPKNSKRLESGFYVAQKDKFVIVNGFNPMQLESYYSDDSKLVVMLLSSNTEWKKLRLEMIGNTFPEKAESGSIRGSIYADPENYGVTEVSIENNFCHLSAGPFEGHFEILNFLKLLNLEKGLETLISRELKKEEMKYLTDLSESELLRLFDKTENEDTCSAVSILEFWDC